MYRPSFVVTLVLCLANYANAQPLNIDFGFNALRTPNTYGAVGQVGCWNVVNGMTAGIPVALGGLTGASGACAPLPGVTITASANSNPFFNLGTPNGDATLPNSPEE